MSLASVSLATLVSLTLPKVEKTLYFHRARDLDNGDGPPPDGHTSRGELRGVSKTNPFFRIRRDFVMAFRSPYVFKWSLWWALAMCGNFQVGNYIQVDDAIYTFFSSQGCKKHSAFKLFVAL